MWRLRSAARKTVSAHNVRRKTNPALIQDRHLVQIDIAIYYGYNRHMKVSVADAKNKLPKLIKAAEEGERVTICRHGRPVADIVRTTKTDAERPQFGTLKGKVTPIDPNWWRPLTDEEVEALFDGR